MVSLKPESLPSISGLESARVLRVSDAMRTLLPLLNDICNLLHRKIYFFLAHTVQCTTVQKTVVVGRISASSNLQTDYRQLPFLVR